MTAFVTTNIPSNVNSLEKLAVWLGILLSNVNPTLAVVENPNETPQKVCQTAFFRAQDNTLRLSIRLSIPIDGNYATYTKKFWENAQDISNVTIPTGFTSN